MIITVILTRISVITITIFDKKKKTYDIKENQNLKNKRNAKQTKQTKSECKINELKDLEIQVKVK